MQRWIALAAIVLCLLGGATVVGVWKHRQNRPDKRWVPLPFNPDANENQREASVVLMRERLLTDEILTGLVRDCNVQGEWKLATEEAAVEELKKRIFIDAGETSFNGVPAPTLNIGFRGTVGQKQFLDLLAGRLMEDVKRLISPQAPADPPES